MLLLGEAAIAVICASLATAAIGATVGIAGRINTATGRLRAPRSVRTVDGFLRFFSVMSG